MVMLPCVLVLTVVGSRAWAAKERRLLNEEQMQVVYGPGVLPHQKGLEGAMNITLNGYPVVLSGLPEADPSMWNGTACVRFPSYNYAKLDHSTLWDAVTNTSILQYGWGNLTVTHTISGPSSVDMAITILNSPKNRSQPFLVPLCGIGLLPFDQHINTSNHRVGGGFGPCPGVWNDGCYPGGCPLDYPQAICMDWGNASAAWVQIGNANETGFELTANSCSSPGQAFYTPQLSQATGRRIEIDESVTIRFSLRFGPGWNSVPKGESGAMQLIRNELEEFGQAHPFQNIDLDGGTMAALFPSDTSEAASEMCSSTNPSDCPNPRGWNFLGCRGKKNQSMCNVTTPEGIANFEAKTRAYIADCVARCQRPELKCRSIMVWSIEGSEWADITYAGSPDMLPELAPEMDKIADELFGIITRAGIRAGVTLRPQIITKNSNWNASVPPDRAPYPYYQKKLLLSDGQPDEDAIFANLLRKAKYAINRWNTSVFYVDSTGFPLVNVWSRLRTELPNIVFIPEQSGPLDFQTVTPLQNDWNGAPIGVNPFTKVIWPKAYNYQLMQVDVDETRYPVSAWVPLAQQGDVFRIDGSYDSSKNKFIEQVLAAAEGTRA